MSIVHVRVIGFGLRTARTDDMAAMVDDLRRHGGLNDQRAKFDAAMGKLQDALRDVVRQVNESSDRIRGYGRCLENAYRTRHNG